MLSGVVDKNSQIESNQSDLERGIAQGGRRTKYETQQLMEAGGQNKGHLQKATMDFIAALIEKTLRIAAKFDTEPIDVDMMSYNVTLNDPSDPRSGMDEILKEYSAVKILPTSLHVFDDEAKKQKGLAGAQLLQPFVGSVIDPAWYGEHLLDLIGVADKAGALMSPQAQREAAMGQAQQTYGPKPAPAAQGPMGQMAQQGMPGIMNGSPEMGLQGLPE